eukprot:jgi/Undpi1/5024/HiC_scaffold_19.g08376.m1
MAVRLAGVAAGLARHTSGLPPKLVTATRSEWEQTMQVVLTLFLDRRSGRFQDKEYKLRLVQRERNQGMIMAPAIATFTLDASLYAHLGAGPSVEQPVDLYAPKLNGPGGFATVHLRVRCCEPGGGAPPLGRSISAPNVTANVRSGAHKGMPPRNPQPVPRPSLPSLPPLQSGLLVGSSFGFSMSGSESRYSAASTGSSAFSTPILRRPGGRPWSTEDLDAIGSSLRSRSSMRTRSRSSIGTRSSLRSKIGSKSFNDLDDSGHFTSSSSKQGGGGGGGWAQRRRTFRSSSISSFRGMMESTGENSFDRPVRSCWWWGWWGRCWCGGGGGGGGGDVGVVGVVGVNVGLGVGVVGGFGVGAGLEGGGGVYMAENSIGPPGAFLCIVRVLALVLGGRVGGSGVGAGFVSAVGGGSPRRRFGASSSRATSAAGGMLTSQSSCSTLSLADRDSRATERDSRATDRNSRATTDRDRDRSRTKSGASREPIAQRYDRTATAGYTRLLARFTKGPSPRGGRKKPGMPGGRYIVPGKFGAPMNNGEGVGIGNLLGGDKRRVFTFANAGSSSTKLTAAQVGPSTSAPASAAPSATAPGPSPCHPPPQHPPLRSIMTVARGAQPASRVGVAMGPGGGASAASRSGMWRMQSDDSGGGGSAVAAPLTSAVGGGGGVGGGGKGSGLGLGLEEDRGVGAIDRKSRVLHLEAALVRSELDLCQAKTELAAARQELRDLRKEKEALERAGQTAGDSSALYHALEGSVVLLQVASEKMLHLEQTISKNRNLMPERIFNELQVVVSGSHGDCVLVEDAGRPRI